MFTLIIAILLGVAGGFLSWGIYPGWSNSIDPLLFALTVVAVVIAFNFFMGRHFMKKLTDIFNLAEKDIKAGKYDQAIEKMKRGYKYNNWQFLVKNQIDGQIGAILYANKKFEESLPYLKNAIAKNWMAQSMLAAYYFKQKDYDSMKKVLIKATASNKKDSFIQVLNGYLLAEIGEVDNAIAALTKAQKKLKDDERLQAAVDALRNKRKIKMQAYGAIWMQLHLSKMPDGVKQYQTLITRQKIKRR